MKRRTLSRTLSWAALCALALASQAVRAETYYLRAAQTTLSLPGGATTPMWGFALDSGAAVDDGTVAVPGPRLTVSPGQALTVVLKNRLPASIPGVTTDVSLIIPGAVPDADLDPVRNAGGRITSFTQVTTPGNNGSYTWTNLPPGTYLYHSGTHPQVQVQMGLYGAVTKDSAAGEAYPGVIYDQDLLLLFSEVDLTLHAAVDGGTYGTAPAPTSTMYYKPSYFLINGKPFPEVPPVPAFAAGDQVLLRLVNAGIETHIPLFQGLYVRQVAEAANKLTYPRETYSVVLGAGATADALLLGPSSQLGGCNFPVFDRAMNLTNAAATGGGMLTYLSLTAGGPAPPRVGDTLMAAQGTGTVTLTWTDIPEANFYRVYSSTTPGPADFTNLQAVASSGAVGATLSLPPEPLVFFQVTGCVTCGAEGPQK
ncbi:MAG: hypothetical protein AB1347_07615 [Acidobacteriota bacterium]